MLFLGQKSNYGVNRKKQDRIAQVQQVSSEAFLSSRIDNLKFWEVLIVLDGVQHV